MDNRKPEFSKEALEKIMKQLSPTDKKRVEQVLKDPQLTQKLLATPQAQALLKKYGDK